jgi:hypothetical protein
MAAPAILVSEMPVISEFRVAGFAVLLDAPRASAFNMPR